MLNTGMDKFNFHPKNIFLFARPVPIYLQKLYVHFYLYMVQSFDGYPAGS
jgi:hypothetical protein